jgi:hypothetical protein
MIFDKVIIYISCCRAAMSRNIPDPAFPGRKKLQDIMGCAAGMLVDKAVNIISGDRSRRACRIVRNDLLQFVTGSIIDESDRAFPGYCYKFRQVQVVIRNAADGLVQVFGQVAVAIISIIAAAGMSILEVAQLGGSAAIVRPSG